MLNLTSLVIAVLYLALISASLPQGNSSASTNGRLVLPWEAFTDQAWTTNASSSNNLTVTSMPPTFNIPGTNPPILLKIFPTPHRTELSSFYLTAAVLQGYTFFLSTVLAAGRDLPIPREGLIFAVGGTSIHASNAVDALREGGVLDYYTLGAAFQAIWWLLHNHGLYTYMFEIWIGSRRDFVAGTVHIDSETINSVKQE